MRSVLCGPADVSSSWTVGGRVGFFRSAGGSGTSSTQTMLTRLEQAGTKARRQLAEVDGVSYYEARK